MWLPHFAEGMLHCWLRICFPPSLCYPGRRGERRQALSEAHSVGTTCQLLSFLHGTLRCRLVLQPAACSKAAFQPYNECYQFTGVELTLEEARVTGSGCYLHNQTSRKILYGVERCYLSTTCKQINMGMLNSIADSLNQLKVHI